MEVTFVRVQGERDRIYVHRTDGSETSWVFPSYGDGIPHDLTHLVVESVCRLRHGFWGRVDAGADPRVVNDEASRIGGADKYTGFGVDQRELMWAEAVAAAEWWRDDLSDDDRVQAVRERFADLPEHISPEGFLRIRQLIGQLGQRWRELLPKGSLRASFDPVTCELLFLP